MNKFNDLETWTPKKQRTLRNALNNRLASYGKSDSPKELQKSHKLAGLTEGQCLELLARIRKLIKIS